MRSDVHPGRSGAGSTTASRAEGTDGYRAGARGARERDVEAGVRERDVDA